MTGFAILNLLLFTKVSRRIGNAGSVTSHSPTDAPGSKSWMRWPRDPKESSSIVLRALKGVRGARSDSRILLYQDDDVRRTDILVALPTPHGFVGQMTSAPCDSQNRDDIVHSYADDQSASRDLAHPA